MSSVCAEQHKFHSSHQLLSPKEALDIPPRKLLSRRTALPASQSPHEHHADLFSESPRGGFDAAAAAAAALQKFLPYNNGGDDSDDSDSDPYSSDHFRMFEFKVRRCTRSRSHDWTDCPFAHPGEKARRRDPRRYHYSGTVCAEYRRGSCSRGDNCEFAHGVFECWLHPSRYRTEACKDGKNCKRKVCFFAHTPRQLRVLPVQPESPPRDIDKKYRISQVSSMNHCCMFCHPQVSSSPTSTLFGMSHLSPPLSPSHQSLSPPLSPMKPHGFGQVSRYVDRLVAGTEASDLSHGLSYKDVLNEIMSSLDVMNMNNNSENVSPHGAVKSSSNLNMTMPWVDVSPNHIDHIDEQQQFILSPSTPSPSVSRGYSFGTDPKGCSDERFNDVGGPAGPDLGWVNDLLM